MTTVAVMLAGCGVLDGSEIGEAVLTLLALDAAGIAYRALAPNKQQAVTHPITKQLQTHVQRNVLEESARIARGAIDDVSEANPADFSALIFPGGFGVAQNLSDFASRGTDMTVQPEVLAFAKAMHQANKPLGFICIAPVLIPSICGPGVQLTIGNNPDLITQVEAMGGVYRACAGDEIVVDEKYRVVSTPAYMLTSSIHQAHQGIEKLVQRIASWLQ